MGREVRRVPLGFDWPVGKIWDGFVNPHYRKCPKCEAGYSRAYSVVRDALAPLVYSRDETVERITTFLCGYTKQEPLRRSVWSACQKLGELAGLPAGWEECTHCEGHGVDPAVRAAYEAWTPTPPPTGDGWQMWETVSEGSPISPVFATPEELARWLADSGASSFGSFTATYEQWLAMCLRGWAPSLVAVNGVVSSGVEADL